MYLIKTMSGLLTYEMLMDNGLPQFSAAFFVLPSYLFAFEVQGAQERSVGKS